MTEADQPEEENLSKFRSLNNDAIQSLLAMLDLSQGFTIAFAECNFWQDGGALVESLKEEIASDPEWEELQLESWEFNDPDLRYLLDELIKRLETLPRQEGKKLVLVLSGLENAIGVVGEYPPFLVDLNFVRDAYARLAPHPVVFVLPDYAITRVANFAPDFWAWKSEVFKFKTSTEARDFAFDKINSDRILGNYLKPEKQERIDLLHRLLMAANPSGSDPASNPNESIQINILIQLGLAYFSLSEFNQAIDFYDQALSLARKLGDRNGEANSLNNLGNAYCSLGQYQQAIQFQQQSLGIRREIGDLNGEAASLGNLGVAYLSLGQYQQVIHLYQQSLEIHREIGDRNGEAASLGNLGVAYASLGQYQQAIQFQQQSLEIKREIGDRNGEADSLNNLGLALKALGRRGESIEAFNASRKIYEELGLYHEIESSDKSFAPLETVAKEPKRFELPDPPKRKRRNNLFQIIFVWLRRIWSKLWRRDQ
ncbi:MAG: tetratricopeptide repeat protein [Pseudanabaena sp.]